MDTKTHIEVQDDLLPLLGSRENILDIGIGSVYMYDFSKANSSYEARVQAVTKVASICYGNPKALGSVKLFERLEAEAAGLPSSSYEFIPVLLSDVDEIFDIVEARSEAEGLDRFIPHIAKYGSIVYDEEGDDYVLTNLRALIHDVGVEKSLDFLNTTEKELKVIRDNVFTFLFSADIPTRTQMIRHRQKWQELSRRYISGKKKEFTFYVSEKMKNVKSRYCTNDYPDELYTEEVINICLNHYYKALEDGVKPEEARRIIPQAAMTDFWGAFDREGLINFIKLRSDSHAQFEIRNISTSIEAILEEIGLDI